MISKYLLVQALWWESNPMPPTWKIRLPARRLWVCYKKLVHHYSSHSKKSDRLPITSGLSVTLTNYRRVYQLNSYHGPRNNSPGIASWPQYVTRKLTSPACLSAARIIYPLEENAVTGFIYPPLCSYVLV